jgi:DNA-binding CsgD family transcriptional regulator
MAAWALTVSAGDSGRTDEAVAAATAGYPIGIRGYLVIVDAHLSALLLAGRIAEAEDVAALLRQRSVDYPSPELTPVSIGVSGRAVLGAGGLGEATTLLGSAIDRLVASRERIGWTYRYLLALVVAHAMAGNGDQAAAAMTRAGSVRHPGWRCLDYEYGIARAWASASQGLVTEAIELVTSSAENARERGQLAAEVMCLQTAAQFGDHSCAPRLRQLCSLVEGPRASLAARFAAALASGNADSLSKVSADFESAGDLIAAADAAAHAAALYRRDGRRGSSLSMQAYATGLSRRCGGAATPALRLATERIVLTPREREVAVLIGRGLSNPAIAKRLSLSVRTVEGHVYRAMARTGAADREELAAMLLGLDTD